MTSRTDAVIALAAAITLAFVGCANVDPAGPAPSPTVASEVSTVPTVAKTTLTPAAPTTSATPRATPTSSVTPTSAKSTAKSPRNAGKPVTQPALGTKVDCSKVACVALTFDDGPGSQAVNLVNTLTKARTPATFFMLSSVAANNKAGAAAVARSPYMEIGNHSISHANLPKLGVDGQKREIVTSKQRLAAQTGRDIRLFRPPYGAQNASVKKIAASSGQAIILWDVDTLDWQHRNPAKVVSIAMSEVRPGSIILLHDIHATTVRAVPNLIVALNKAGYTLVTVGTLLGQPVPGKVYSSR